MIKKDLGFKLDKKYSSYVNSIEKGNNVIKPAFMNLFNRNVSYIEMPKNEFIVLGTISNSSTALLGSNESDDVILNIKLAESSENANAITEIKEIKVNDIHTI